MTSIDLVIFVIAVLTVGFGIAHNLRRRKKAKECGTVSCSGCIAAGSCSAKKPE